MQRVIAAARERAIDRDEMLDVGDLCRKDNSIPAKTDFLGSRGGTQRRLHHGLAGHGAGRAGRGRPRIFVHEGGEKFLIEGPPVCADPHRLAMLERGFDDRRKLPVLLVLEADIAGIDPIFVERFGTGGMIGQKLVADIMEIADQRHMTFDFGKTISNVRHGGGGFIAVDGQADEF